MQTRSDSQPRLFVGAWLAATVLLAGLLIALDVCVDPYLVMGAPRIAGLNAIKPEAESHTALAKRYLLPRAHPAGLIIGDSKADIGLDPQSPAWPDEARPVFNDGLPGAGLEDMLAQLRHALSIAPVRRALVMLDMQSLLAAPLPLTAADSTPPLPALPFVSVQLSDLLLSTLSIDAVQASLLTLAGQRSAEVADLSDQGSTSEGGFSRDVSAEGEHALFVQKDAALADRFARLAAFLARHSEAARQRIGLVADMIAACRARHVALDIVIPPYHADYLDIAVHAGLWQRFEGAKAALTSLVAGSGGAARLWDFEGYDSYAADLVPPASAGAAPTAWFWEPTHFKKRLGAKILAAIYRGAAGYGTQLSPATLPARLAADQQAMQMRFGLASR